MLNRLDVPKEILENEYEETIPVLSYNYNNINREILKMPGLEEEMIAPKKKRLIPSLEIEAG
jgi:hypothetical protein